MCVRTGCNAEPEQVRNPVIDCAKGIILIAVVLSHTCGFLIGTSMVVSYMAVLFVLCGYTQREDLLSANSVNWKALICKRVKNLLLPYLCWNIAVILVHAIRMMSTTPPPPRGVLWVCKQLVGVLYSRACLFPLGTEPNIWLFQVNGAVWFITALFSAYIIFYGSMRLMQGSTLLRKILILLLLLLISVSSHISPYSCLGALTPHFFALF